MSVLAETLLQAGRADHVVLLDRAAPDGAMTRLLEAMGSSASWVRADVCDSSAVGRALREFEVEALVHGAAVTLVDGWEIEQPSVYAQVNTLGTSAVLEAVRLLGRPLRRLIYVSSCAVYGNGTPGVDPQPEAGPVTPSDLYGASKAAAETIVRRYGELFGIPAVIVRPGKLFGPMERPTGARTMMSAPYHVCAAGLARHELLVTERTQGAALDWLSAIDAAQLFVRLLDGAGHDGAVYNMGSGTKIVFADLVELVRSQCGGHPRVRVTDHTRACVDIDPADSLGKDSASDITAARCDLGWSPRSFDDQVRDYLAWSVGQRGHTQGLSYPGVRGPSRLGARR